MSLPSREIRMPPWNISPVKKRRHFNRSSHATLCKPTILYCTYIHTSHAHLHYLNIKFYYNHSKVNSTMYGNECQRRQTKKPMIYFKTRFCIRINYKKASIYRELSFIISERTFDNLKRRVKQHIAHFNKIRQDELDSKMFKLSLIRNTVFISERNRNSCGVKIILAKKRAWR